jgi:hypothetical protein
MLISIQIVKNLTSNPVSICHRSTESLGFMVYSLFNNAFSISDYIVSNERMRVNNELERMWKEGTIPAFAWSD